MSDIFEKANSRFTLRLFSDTEFKNFKRPLSLKEFYEIEQAYILSEWYPNNGYWCEVEKLLYRQYDDVVNVYVKYRPIKKY